MAKVMFEPSAAADLILSGKAPPGLQVDGKLDLSGKPKLHQLPTGLTCYELNASGTGLVSLPDDLSVECALELEGCQRLQTLPANLKVGTLNVANCSNLEAAAAGLCVLTTPVGVANDLITDGENGFIIKEDAADIAKKVIMLKDISLRDRIRKDIREKVVQDFNWKDIIDDYIKTYDEVKKGR